MTIGVLPGEDISMANQWVDIPIATGVGYARNMAVVKSAQAVIAIGGNYGTLSEIAYALKSGIPVIGLNTWSLSRNGKEVDAIIRVGNAEEAVDKAISLAKKGKGEMNPTELAWAIAKKIPLVLPKDANVVIRKLKLSSNWRSCYSKGRVLVWLAIYQRYVTVVKPTRSKKNNSSGEKVIKVRNERGIPAALKEIKKLYLERNS